MTMAMFILGWLACGALGSYLTIDFGWRRGKYARNVNLGDVAFCAFMVMFGPANLFVGALHFTFYIIDKLSDGRVEWNRVIFKARSNGGES